MDVLLLKVAILGLLAPRQARSARHEPLPRVTRVAKVAEGLALPGCPEKCGDMAIPYPFGIGKSCSFPGFEMQCLRTPTGEFHPHVSLGSSSRVRTAPVVNISLFPAKVHILMRPASTCNPSQNVSATPLASEAFSLNYPFMFSSTETLFTVVGCNTLGSVDLGHLGCAALCDATLPNTTGDGRCSGVGCCQVAVAPSLRRFFPQLNDLRMTLQMSYLTECVSAFLVESGKYSFKKDDFNMDISDRSYPVVLDWSIRNILDDAKLETGGTYSWRGSPNSVCLKSATGFGHTCKCATGFQGNPYLPNGCQDIDECEKSYQCMGGRICLNLIGNYTCVCPNGTIDKGMGYPCMHKDQKYLQIPIGMALGIGISLGVLLLLGAFTLVYKRVQNRQVKQCRIQLFKKNHDLLLKKQSDRDNNIIGSIKFFSLRDLEKATNNFDRTCVVGKGGHGTVYKALLNLQVVAIKKSNVTTEREIEEFINEIILLSQVNHRNVVKFIGCCLETEVPLLVYEFISNGTLFDHLHNQNENTLLSWDDRLKIAIEMTSALAYLHSAANISIFHRDIKTSNILLDERLSVKISDFGASKYMTLDQTHITTNVQGTFGYLDPEYLHTCQLTEKTDVYSLGVILIELLTGQKPTSRLRFKMEGSLIRYFIIAMNENRLLQVVDPSIIEDINAEEVEIFARSAMACLSMKGKDRPTMKNLLAVFEGLMIKTKYRKIRNTSKNHNENENLLLGMFMHFNSGATITNNGDVDTHSTLQMHTL